MSKRKPSNTLMLLMLPTIILVGSASILMLWPRPTKINLRVTANRVDFTVGKPEETVWLNELPFHSITIEDFSEIELTPNIAFPFPSCPAKPEAISKSSSNAPTKSLTIKGGERSSQVTIEGLASKENARDGRVRDLLLTQDLKIALRASGVQRACIELSQKDLSLNLEPPTPFCLSRRTAPLQEATRLLDRSDSSIMIPELAGVERYVRIQGNPNALTLCVMVPPPPPAGDTGISIGYNDIPISNIKFVEITNNHSSPVSTLTEGEIFYPDFPKQEKVIIANKEFLTIEQLQNFKIKEIMFQPNSGNFTIKMEGIAGTIKSDQKDRRLTLLDILWQNPKIALLLTIILWSIPTTIGAYKLYKEIKG